MKKFKLSLLLLSSLLWLACSAEQPNQPTKTGASPSPGAPTAGSPDQVALEDGKKLFGTKCSFCHGATGHPAEPNNTGATDLTAKDFAEDHISQVIKEGKDKMMPVKGLSDDEVAKIAKYVRTLKK